ncbi:type IV pilus assembly PilZ [Sulfobacillus acidophilus DSM 10332]|uniref:Type IV pilus assembly PilZ n=1 Tax=Sulfobacillus acidophilus (strain ATCC 700253 / DSM 10332 / NAL) TaxID=679936 RepID=G8U1J3_SULAD|nr:type IV pilus assembly PilZ [Sulfobacillus acidophilus DSM 10332]
MALEMNQPVQLVLQRRVVRSRVIRTMKQEVYIDALRDEEMELTPLIGDKIAVRWAEDDVLYQQIGRVSEVLDPIPIIVVRLEGPPRVVEFRQATRVRVGLPLEYGLLRPDSEMLVTTTMDISSTGLRFPAAVKLWMGLELRLRVRVEQRILEVTGKVVRVAPKARELRGRQSWETAVQFTKIAPGDRKLLEQYVRRQQSRLQIGRS